MANRKRDIQMKFWVTEEEKVLIEEKMKLLPTQRYGAYLRKMAIDGYIIYTDTADIRDQYVTALVRQLDLTAEQAETIFYFQLNGCLAINKKIYRNGSKNWEASRDLIGSFIQSGLKRYCK